MAKQYDLTRFTRAHEAMYQTALTEIRNGRKVSHWMWYIFPQLKGLGHSSMAYYFGLDGADEAAAFLRDARLEHNLVEICEALLELPSCDPGDIFGFPDNLKLHSCMTLFSLVAEDRAVFDAVLEKFYGGERDVKTLGLLSKGSDGE